MEMDGKHKVYINIQTLYLCIIYVYSILMYIVCVYCIHNVLECSSTTLPKGESSVSIEYQ